MTVLPQFSDERALKYFAPLERKFLMTSTPVLELRPGETLVRQGQANGVLYLIESGSLDVVTEANGREELVTVLRDGDVIGELAFLTGMPSTATLRATAPTRVHPVTHDSLVEMGKESPELLGKFSLALCELIAHRMRATIETLATMTETLQTVHTHLIDMAAMPTFMLADREALTQVEHTLCKVG